MKRVLITGGAGFIGYHTAREFLKRDWGVKIFDDLSTGKHKNIEDLQCEFGDRVEFIEGDICGRDGYGHPFRFEEYVGYCDSVIHLAAQVSVQFSIKDPIASTHNNLLTFLRVLEACRTLGKPLVYASSAAVYGAGTAGSLTEFSESSRAPLSPYGLDKLVTDMYAHLYYQLYKVKSIGLRYFNVYGPRQDPSSPYSGVISKFISLGLEDLPLTINGDGEQTRNFINVDDVAKINFMAGIGHFRHQGPLNVGNPEAGSITINELVRTINRVLPTPVTVTHGKGVLGDIRNSVPNLFELQGLIPAHDFVNLETGLNKLIEYIRSNP